MIVVFSNVKAAKAEHGLVAATIRAIAKNATEHQAFGEGMAGDLENSKGCTRIYSRKIFDLALILIAYHPADSRSPRGGSLLPCTTRGSRCQTI